MNSYLTVKDVMRILQVGRTTAYALIRSGRLHSYKMGQLVRVHPEDLRDFVEGVGGHADRTSGKR